MFYKILCTLFTVLFDVRTIPLDYTIIHYHSTLPALLWPLLQLMSNQLFPPSIKLHTKRTCLLKFLNHCFQTHGSHLSNAIFHILEIMELLQSYWCTIIFLVKKPYKQSVDLLWNIYVELLRHKIRKRHLAGVFITTAMSPVHERHFYLHIL